jgi:hypothetical protein
MHDDFYFGCWDRSGHFLVTPGGRHVYDNPKDFPVREGILDGGLLPPFQPQVEGRAVLVHLSGWTILSFWDRSVDTRGGCSSSFVMRGTLDFVAATQRARERFPQVWNRYTFEVVLGTAP